jgi:hypothetical protein
MRGRVQRGGSVQAVRVGFLRTGCGMLDVESSYFRGLLG